jgi:hypothetical protein
VCYSSAQKRNANLAGREKVVLAKCNERECKMLPRICGPVAVPGPCVEKHCRDDVCWMVQSRCVWRAVALSLMSTLAMPHEVT